ncbi:MAG: hypothetical protein ACRCSW_00270 [Tabrizicola sp.]
MDLVETMRPGKKHDDPLHSYTVKAGKSITLNTRPGMRRRWQKA